MNGKVERRIRHVKNSIEKTISLEKLSLLQWETVCAQISNAVNDLPLALGNKVGDFENLDVLTPNRLKLGRNNNRSPVGTMELSTPSKLIESNKAIFNKWFEVWLISFVPKLMEQPKWFKSERDVKIGDVVLFLKNEGFTNNYQYGMIHGVQRSEDGLIRKVIVKYRNANEETDRFTWRAVRSLVLIHPIDEINLAEKLHEAQLIPM